MLMYIQLIVTKNYFEILVRNVKMYLLKNNIVGSSNLDLRNIFIGLMTNSYFNKKSKTILFNNNKLLLSVKDDSILITFGTKYEKILK